MAAGSTYTPIATTTLGSAQASYTFSSIPSTYTDLVLIAMPIVSINDNMTFQFNGDTATNYSTTILYGTGSAAGSTRQSNVSVPYLSYYGSAITNPTPTLISIQNYANTTTNKTFLSRANAAASGVDAIVGMWRSLNAINSILIKTAGGNNFQSGTTFTLYGIAAA